MIEISHGWTPTTPAIQPAEGCSVPTWVDPVEELVGVLLEAAEVLGLEQPHAAGLAEDLHGTVAEPAQVVAGDELVTERRGGRGDVGAGLVHRSQPFFERSRTTLARVTATTRPAP